MRQYISNLRMAPAALAITIGLAGPAWAGEAEAYLGLVAAPVDDTVASQLDLREGMGLTVVYVDPDGAVAETVREHDILQMLGDQLLVNPEQLARLVQMFDPGDPVELTVLRRGEQTKVTATLQERTKENDSFGGQLMFTPRSTGYGMGGGGVMGTPRVSRFGQQGGDLKDILSKVEEELSGRLDNVPELSQEIIDQTMEQVEKAVRSASESASKMRLDFGPKDSPLAELGVTAMGGMGPSADFDFGMETTTSVNTLVDDGMTVMLRVTNGEAHLTAKDSDGKMLFDGPVNTEDERAEMPEEVEDRYRELQKAAGRSKRGSRSSGTTLRMAPGGGAMGMGGSGGAGGDAMGGGGSMGGGGKMGSGSVRDPI